MYDNKKFFDPPRKYRVNLMAHVFSDIDLQMQAYIAHGYNGVVTNVPPENGFTSNKENIAAFSDIIDALDKNGIPFWIYDESGYPSGRAGGLALTDHPELQAKGFYMHRRISYEPAHAKYRLDDEAERIIWAAKYPFELVSKSETVVDFDKMIPLDFTDDFVECELDGREIMYVFCVKNAYEGSHSTHNVCSLDRNINIMDKKAVARFIECAYEPIAAKIPDAFSRCVNVFTDEPSLHTAYVREDESWPFALAPYCDELFEEYEKMHGLSLLPYLPLVFEGGTRAYPTRVKFYRTVGKLIADAYSGQLSEWCEKHGGGFSGHYLCEENLTQHIRQYGDFISVLMKTTVPGIDILECMPDIYEYETAKYAQIAARKKNTGIMVELCPFVETEKFSKAPFDYMKVMTAVLALSGVRYFNSYFRADFSEWCRKKTGQASHSWVSGGYGGVSENKNFNEYVGRICYLLDGLANSCDTFVYYAYEDAAAKQIPLHCSGWKSGEQSTHRNSSSLTRSLFENGFDYYYADSEDLNAALKELDANGTPKISGCRVKTFIVPEIDVMERQSVEILKKLEKAGVEVIYIGHKPTYAAEDGKELDFEADVTSVDSVIQKLRLKGGIFNSEVNGTLLRGKFVTENGVLYMLVNPAKTDCSIEYNGEKNASLYDVSDGSVKDIIPETEISVPAMRCVFVLV